MTSRLRKSARPLGFWVSDHYSDIRNPEERKQEREKRELQDILFEICQQSEKVCRIIHQARLRKERLKKKARELVRGREQISRA